MIMLTGALSILVLGVSLFLEGLKIMDQYVNDLEFYTKKERNPKL